MVTINTFRELALSFRESTEQSHFEKTSFRMKKRYLLPNEKRNRACVKISEVDQDVFSAVNREIIYLVENKWGKQGWTLIELKKITKSLFPEILTAAYNEVN